MGAGKLTDDEKAIAEKMLKRYPLACPVVYIGNKDEPAVLETFGPVWSPTVFAVDEEGKILGRFDSAAEALGVFGE